MRAYFNHEDAFLVLVNKFHNKNDAGLLTNSTFFACLPR
jgi:hypothetical protein